jgi:hypothetical protein
MPMLHRGSSRGLGVEQRGARVSIRPAEVEPPKFSPGCGNESAVRSMAFRPWGPRTASRALHAFLKYVLVLGLLSALVAAQDDSEDKHKPASISGTVTNSLTGAPLPHAHVRLAQKGRTKPVYGALSNEQGRFSITTVEPGTYVVNVEHRGYAPVSGNWSIGGARELQEVTLKAGEDVKDFALQLVPNAVISGRVVDVNGVPLNQVIVAAINGGSRHSVETDYRGQFRVGGLSSGRYLIKALSEGWNRPPEVRTDGTAETNYAPTYYPGSRTAESAQPVQARAGEETTGIEIKMLPGPVLHVSGTVAPVGKAKGFSVIIEGHRPGPNYDVGPDMRFTMWRLAPGQYQILAQHFDFDKGGGPEMRSAPAMINLTTSSIDGIHLVPSPPFELAMQIELDESAVRKKANKEPMVELQLVGSLQRDDPDVETNPDGSVKIADIFPGLYRVSPDGSSQDSYYVKSVRLGGKEFDDGIVDLRGGPQKGPMIVQLASDGAEITGVVRDQKGPVAGAEVTLLYDDEFGFDVAAAGDTQPDGSYAFNQVAPGKYKIFACDPKQAGDEWTNESLALYLSVTERIEVQEADKITQDLKFLP